jgi:uncharacterized protein (DUF1800 family)
LIATRFPELSWTIPQALAKVKDQQHWEFMISVSMATIARAVWSKRQLFEVMCEFWSNHLNVTAPTDSAVWSGRHDYDRTVIRAHALGRFEDMLVASAQHPAMLHYLNNAESTKDEPNENYGRELLELHTLGLDAGYTELDMVNSTLIMTGFTVNPGTGKFEYNPAYHFTGDVQVMSFTDTNVSPDGQAVGVSYLQYLANHPATAHHIAHKLCVRFVSDDPDPTLVDDLAQVYLDSGTAMAPVLKQLFLSTAFQDSVGRKMRRPFEDIVATMRILGYQPERRGVSGMRSLYWICEEVGHAPLGWDMPNGYPDDAVSWLSAGTTLNRWNRHLSLAAHWFPKPLRRPELRTLLPHRLPSTYGEMVDDLAKRLVFRTLSKEHKHVVLTFLGKKSGDRFTSRDAAANYQMAPAAAIILDSPYHGVR